MAADCATVSWAHAKMICSEFVWAAVDLRGRSCDSVTDLGGSYSRTYSLQLERIRKGFWHYYVATDS